MDDTEIVALYRDWCREADAQPSHTSLAVAWEAMTGLSQHNPERAWRLLVEVVAGLDEHETWALDSLGADNLENLLGDHGDRFIDRVEHLAHKDTGFRLALRSVWLPDGDVRDRVRKAVVEDNDAGVGGSRTSPPHPDGR